MANTAWGVISWVSVDMDVAEWQRLVMNFRHSVTSIHGETDPHGCHYGYTLWKANRPDDRDIVGMAWDWREMRPGAVGIDDPMSILTNVRLLRDGRVLSRSERVLELNNAVYRIGWQRVARRQLQARQEAWPPASIVAERPRTPPAEHRAATVPQRPPVVVRPVVAARTSALAVSR